MTACSCGQTVTTKGLNLSHCLTPFLPLRQPCSSTHLSRLSLCANILQSFPLVCGASRLPHNFCRMETGMRKAFGPTSVVMLLAGSNRDVSILWESCRKKERKRGWRRDTDGNRLHNLTPSHKPNIMSLKWICSDKISVSGLFKKNKLLICFDASWVIFK